ncbi:MAG: hypothetical protein M0P66_14240 [Salinivirgaceae bacterium]|nr:hypothetical protein [Salinivirgaceae bacterium]
MNSKNLIIFLGMALLVSCTAKEKETGPAKVEVKANEAGQYRMFVNGSEFYVNGAGCEFGNIDALGISGANSFRTWRTENGQKDAVEILDLAQKNGLMVLMGLEVARERHGYSYSDTAMVNKQYNYIKGEVERLKNHPALLGWAIGNELNLGANDLRIYDAVNDLSKMIHEIDPNHPTTTTLAGIGKREIDYIKVHCTDIDFISIQMYGDIVNLQTRISDAGWVGPYMVTEWGATGHWEVGKTSWDAPIEQTSREKAKAFLNRYDLAIEANKKFCLGSYVFLWGQKQERTPTWYGMHLENGAKTETVDAMTYVWTGKWPENRCPSLDSFKIENGTAFDNLKLKARSQVKAEVFYKDFENDSLTFTWELIPESTDLGWGGDLESRPSAIFHLVGNSSLVFTTPEKEGAYRLFVYIQDAKSGAATANFPFWVDL